MEPRKALRTLTAVTPLALAVVLASAPQASAGIGGAALDNPHVMNQGSTLGITFSSAITDNATDNAVASNVANAFGGDWLGGLVANALHNAPPRTSTCQVTATATDSDGATGTASATVAGGVTDNQLEIPDQKQGTKWGVGDLDHFSVQLICTDTQTGGQVSKATIDQDQAAG